MASVVGWVGLTVDVAAAFEVGQCLAYRLCLYTDYVGQLYLRHGSLGRQDLQSDDTGVG